MDRLNAGEELGVDQQLVSGNRWLTLVLQGDGNLVLYRTQVMQALWASATDGRPVTRAVMQTDGNFVAYTAQGVALWASHTEGHPGAFVVVQDDGNLVIYEGGTALWASDTVQDFSSPTIALADAEGLSYVETSERWKELCSGLPCFAALQWPGYSTTFFDDVIDGQPVVIQLWKGWCQKFLGLQFMPGGVGAEVGVYRRIPGKLAPTSLPFLPPELASFLLGRYAQLTDNELWWPAPELNARLEFSYVNPLTGQAVFAAGPETSYWLTRWMNEPSYISYWFNHRDAVPTFPNDYVLEYRINGKPGRWPSLPGGTPTSGDDMQPDEVLTVNASIRSADGRFRLIYQDDSNLVLYRDTDGVALWDTRPRPGGVGVCIMQSDGNLVVYNASNQPVWASNTDGNPGSSLALQNDGNLVIYRPDGTAIWATGTVQP